MPTDNNWPQYGFPRWERTIERNAPRLGLSEKQLTSIIRQAWEHGHIVGVRQVGKNKSSPLLEYHKCSMCEKELPVSEFYLSAKGYVQTYCKACSKKHAKEWEARNHELVNARKRDRHAGRIKTCNECFKDKAYVDFYRASNSNYIQSSCKKCYNLNKSRRRNGLRRDS